MPAIHSLDTYLERSTSLLESNPNNTLVSITYHNKNKKNKSTEDANSKSEGSKNVAGSGSSTTTRLLSFKTYNDSNGICYRFTTNKAKDLSRVLTALGPKGVQFTKSKKVASKKRKSELDSTSDKNNKKSKMKKSKGEEDIYSVEKYSVNGKGFSSIMSNVEFKSEELDSAKGSADNANAKKTQEVNSSTVTANKSSETSSKKKKNKKKKGKK